MRRYIVTLLFLSVVLYGQILYASCSDEEDCDGCADLQSPPTSEQRACVLDGDCTLIEDGCGGWLSVRTDKVDEVKGQVNMVRPSCDSSAKAKCVFSSCRVKGRYVKNVKETCE